MKKKIKEKILCKTCFWRGRFRREDWCKLIENEGGGSIETNQIECKFYLKKGTEPKWICCVCKKNTYGEASTSFKRKHYCDSCWFKKERREGEIKKEKRLNEALVKIKQIIKSL